jgi:hypothetical protein
VLDTAVSTDALMALYKDAAFVPSRWLKDMSFA